MNAKKLVPLRRTVSAVASSRFLGTLSVIGVGSPSER
jgi:hypothetical protein